MKLNSETKISGNSILLVPYRKHHVPKYHQWMQSEELQKLTASQPLTLEEEYEMQKSWREDEDKCTFILLDKNKFNNLEDETDPSTSKDVFIVTPTLKRNNFSSASSKEESMIGDTNIFITDKESAVGEIEIMIAEKSARGKRLGWEAVILMLIYGIKYININMFEAKIALANNISITMFKKLGFEEKSTSKVFQEITLEKKVTSEWSHWLESHYQLNIQSH